MLFFFLCIIFQTNKWDAIMNQSGLSDSIARPLCALILIKHSRIIMPDSVANWILMKPEFDISFLSVVSLCYDRKSGYRQGMLYVASIGAFWYLRWLIFNVFCSCATPVHVLSGLIPPCQVLAMVLVFWRWNCFKCLFYDGWLVGLWSWQHFHTPISGWFWHEVDLACLILCFFLLIAAQHGMQI